MPKIVDWDAKRDEILSATWRVIARDGLARATITAIAREAKCSRGILAHYFDDKADILGSAMMVSHRRFIDRIDAQTAGRTGLDALRVTMLEALPFWGRALGTPALRDLQNTEFDQLVSRLRGHLAQARDQGELAGGLDLDFAAHQLVVLIDGLSAERVLYPDRVSPERQVTMLDHLLASFRPVAPAAVAAVPEPSPAESARAGM